MRNFEAFAGSAACVIVGLLMAFAALTPVEVGATGVSAAPAHVATAAAAPCAAGVAACDSARL
jgi:hypothetical protein